MNSINAAALRSKFIVIEGIDGAGKDSVTHALKNLLASLQLTSLKDTIITAEPTLKSPACLAIAKVLKQSQPLSPEQCQALAKLYIEDRQFHQKTLQFYKKHQKLILCVRYDLSTYAYQSAIFDAAARKTLFAEFYNLHAYNKPHGSLIPDLTYFLDIPLQTSKKRVQSRGKSLHFYEKQQTSFTKNVITAYHQAIEFLIKKDNRNIAVIDATQNIETILPVLKKHLIALTH
ncbi:thymidylate kinase [Spirochaetota bacterium]|nr:thymidylate kinase [Spirochaetota bacterium]